MPVKPGRIWREVGVTFLHRILLLRFSFSSMNSWQLDWSSIVCKVLLFASTRPTIINWYRFRPRHNFIFVNYMLIVWLAGVIISLVPTSLFGKGNNRIVARMNMNTHHIILWILHRSSWYVTHLVCLVDNDFVNSTK